MEIALHYLYSGMYYRRLIIRTTVFFGILSLLIIGMGAVLEPDIQPEQWWKTGLTWLTVTLVFSVFTVLFNLKKTLRIEGDVQELRPYLLKQLDLLELEQTSTGEDVHIFQSRRYRYSPIYGPVLLDDSADDIVQVSGPARYVHKLYRRLQLKGKSEQWNVRLSM